MSGNPDTYWQQAYQEVSATPLSQIKERFGVGDLFAACKKRADELRQKAAVRADQLTGIVNAFLCWRLPAQFAPDAGVTFTPYPHQTPDGPHWPVGTNLLTADQARAMFAAVIPTGLIDDAAMWDALRLDAENHPLLRDALHDWLTDYKAQANEQARADHEAAYLYATTENRRLPEPETPWRHRNGGTYVVIGIANPTPREGYVPTVVYKPLGRNTLYTRPLSDWHRSMTPLADD